VAKYSGGGSQILNLQFGALAEETRRRIMIRLESGPAPLGELAQIVGLALPTVLKHTRVLERARLVRTQKVGRARMCELHPRTAEASVWLEEHVQLWSSSLSRLARLMAPEKRR